MTEVAITLADTGLGTTYERWALNRVLLTLQKKYAFQSLIEGPGDGMTGINGLNSLILGLQGDAVTLVLDHEAQVDYAQKVWKIHAPQAELRFETNFGPGFADDSVDLVWNFNVMTRAANPSELLAEMARISRRYVFFCVPNAQNYSFWLHRLHHKVAQEPWDHGEINLMRPKPWQRIISEMGFSLKEIIYLDCPWWPDIVDLGQLIADFFPFMKGTSQKAKPENRMKWEAEALPYYQPERYPEIHQQMEKLARFEKSRFRWVNRLFAHHAGIFLEI